MVITERSMRRRLAVKKTSPTNLIFLTKNVNEESHGCCQPERPVRRVSDDYAPGPEMATTKASVNPSAKRSTTLQALSHGKITFMFSILYF